MDDAHFIRCFENQAETTGVTLVIVMDGVTPPVYL